jgi:hypothetical protein
VTTPGTEQKARGGAESWFIKTKSMGEKKSFSSNQNFPRFAEPEISLQISSSLSRGAVLSLVNQVTTPTSYL